MTDEPERKAARSPRLRAILRVLRLLAAVGLGLVAAVLVFNFLIMPAFVRHGREVVLPDVAGLTLEEAERILVEADLAVRDTVERWSADVPAGRVLEETPPAGSRVKPGRGAVLVVSRGLKQQRVPEVAGQTLRYARLTLSQQGYELGDVLRVPSDEVTRGFVITSEPPPGSVLAQGERVNLLVSDGPEEPVWIMPDLRGRDLRLTADKLRFAGFEVLVTRGEVVSLGVTRIVSTDPPPGSQVTRSDAVRLVGG